MSISLINPADSLERQNEKLLEIVGALMRKVEKKNEQSGVAYAQFERAAVLEVQVRERTMDLERTLDLLQESNAQLAKANRETQIARETLIEAIETVSEGFALFGQDDQLVLFNSRFCRELTDIESQLREGLSFAQYVKLVSNSRQLSLPDTMTPNMWARQRTLRHRDDRVVFNVSLTHDRWLQVSEHRTARGGTVILQTDVTNIIRLERKEREKIRDEQAQILRATLDHLNQGVCIFDRDKNLVGWNKRLDYLLDLPPQELALGRSFRILLERLREQLEFDDEFDGDKLIGWANYNEGRTPVAFEVVRAGKQILNVFAQEMPDQGFVISFTDVTAEREATRALSDMNEMLEGRVQDRTRELGVALTEAERANASKSRFVAAASHDLLQPLSAAKLFINSLANSVVEPGQQDVVAKAESALSSVEQIIEALLDISRLDALRPHLDIRTVQLSAVLEPLRNELTPVAAAKGIDLRIVGSSLSVRSDPGYLRRIIQNLVSNAIRYTDHGKVLVGVRRIGAAARVQVFDTGRGIAQEHQDSIFQEFKRIDFSHNEHSLGLGLAIVDRACKSLDHPLTMSSEIGQGSVFCVDLPVLPGTGKSAFTGARMSPPKVPELDGEIVFLVENDKSLAKAITLTIEGWGGEVIHAWNGEEGLQLLADIDLRPDALVLDYLLGDGMTGLDLLAEIRRIHGDVPARIVSANRGPELINACRDADVLLLPKPIDWTQFFEFLSACAVQKL